MNIDEVEFAKKRIFLKLIRYKTSWTNETQYLKVFFYNEDDEINFEKKKKILTEI